MTEQEAAELVLKGRVYETCPNCEGGGRQQSPTESKSGRKKHSWAWRSANSVRGNGVEICKQCSGAGTQTAARFQEACRILDVEATSKSSPPHRPNFLGEWMFDDQTQEWVDVS